MSFSERKPTAAQFVFSVDPTSVTLLCPKLNQDHFEQARAEALCIQSSIELKDRFWIEVFDDLTDSGEFALRITGADLKLYQDIINRIPNVMDRCYDHHDGAMDRIREDIHKLAEAVQGLSETSRHGVKVVVEVAKKVGEAAVACAKFFGSMVKKPVVAEGTVVSEVVPEAKSI